MQLRGWGLTQAGCIVIILLVLQHLGVGQILARAPAPTVGPSLAGSSQAVAALAVVPPLGILFDASLRPSAVLGEHGSWTIPPDPVPLSRWLPRAPPAA
jgi:hypothetical protein